MNITPILLEAAKRYILSPRFRSEDFQFSVERHGHVWDVYKVRGFKKVGQMAVRLDDNGDAVIGWFGPGNHSKEEIVKYIGLSWEIPDA